MDDAELRTERNRRVALVESLRVSLSDIVAAAVDVATDDEHDPEGHTIAFEREQNAALLREAESQLRELDRAIERMSAGTYGLCEHCSKPIPVERLEALPATRLCVICAASNPS